MRLTALSLKSKEVDETGPAQTRSAGLRVQENHLGPFWGNEGSPSGQKFAVRTRAQGPFPRYQPVCAYKKTTWARFGAMRGHLRAKVSRQNIKSHEIQVLPGARCRFPCCGELKKQSVGPSKIASGEQKLPLRRTHGGPANIDWRSICH